MWKLSFLQPECFPDPEQADASGLLAFGGDLSARRLLAAYRAGIFPWYDADTPILWWSPNPRCVLVPDAFRVSSRLARSLRARAYRVTMDVCFSRVIRRCASIPRARPDGAEEESDTWLVPDMIEAYETLHALGVAHSVEVWENGTLAGGLYGVALGSAFFGESMFHERPDASKAALVWFMERFAACGGTLLDCQMPTPHMLRFGAQMMARSVFLKRLAEALENTNVVACMAARGTE